MKSEKFKELVSKYLDGTINIEEEKLLFLYYDKLQENGEEAWNEAVLGLKEEARLRLLDNILNSINDDQQPIKSSGKWRWVSIAAMLLCMLSIGLFFYHNSGLTDLNKIAGKKDIPAGTDKAVLTLADGSKVLLDDQMHGSLARQGNVRIFQKVSGQLVYEQLNTDDAPSTMKYNTISTPKGGQYQIVLPDGTAVWLNAASSITFPTVFNPKERIVSTTGEVYFEVAKAVTNNRLNGLAQQSIPFLVKTKRQTIAVLGTHFNVNAYANEDAIKTALLEGSVRVTDHLSNKSKVLRPGQQSELHEGASDIEVQEVNTNYIVAWKDGVFLFDNAEIDAVMKHLERWYNVDVKYEGKIPDTKYTGRLPRKSSLNKVLQLLERTGPVRFRVEGNIIIVLK